MYRSTKQKLIEVSIRKKKKKKNSLKCDHICKFKEHRNENLGIGKHEFSCTIAAFTRNMLKRSQNLILAAAFKFTKKQQLQMLGTKTQIIKNNIHNNKRIQINRT